MSNVALKTNKTVNRQLTIVATVPMRKSWRKTLVAFISAFFEKLFTPREDEIEVWRRLEYRNEMPRERQIERAQWMI